MVGLRTYLYIVWNTLNIDIDRATNKSANGFFSKSIQNEAWTHADVELVTKEPCSGSGSVFFICTDPDTSINKI